MCSDVLCFGVIVLCAAGRCNVVELDRVEHDDDIGNGPSIALNGAKRQPQPGQGYG